MSDHIDQSQFDPSVFLSSVTTDASLRRPPLPAGSIWPATITKLTPRSWKSEKGNGWSLDIVCKVDLSADPAMVQSQGTTEVNLRDSFFLDMTEGGAIDFSTGKNAGIRRYREATGLNTPGQSFNMMQFEGRQVKVKVKHREYQGELFDEVDSVAKG